MTLNEIQSAIIHGSFTIEQLNTVVDAVKFARARLNDVKKRELRIGDNVNFDSTKLGRNVTGVVMKIAIKYVTVRTVNGLWKVPANMLTKIEDREFA